MRIKRSAVLSLSLCGILAACGGDNPTGSKGGGSPPGQVAPALRVVAGAGVADTVDAILPNEVVVEYRGADGKPAAGARLVVFGSPSQSGLTVRFAQPGSETFAGSAVVSTDAEGRASVRVRLGTLATPTQVTVRLLSDSLVAVSVPLTVLPGTAVRINPTPRDTTLYRGRTYSLTTNAYDRYANPRTDVRFTALTPALVRVGATGGVETLAIGRAAVQLSAGAYSDTVFVSIPPEGVLTATRLGGSGSPFRIRVVSLNFDGTGETVEVQSQLFADAGVAWSPDGSTLAYAVGDHDTNLFRRSGGVTAPLVQTAAPLGSKAFPRYSRDGAWVYFNGYDAGGPALWRVRADGTGVERVGPPTPADGSQAISPDPSPDGLRVAYSTDRVSSTMPVIRVLTIATRAVSAIDVPGVTPRWSPDGRRIAYITTEPQWGYLNHNRAMRSRGALAWMNPDGTGQVMIAGNTKRWLPHFDFSPDGRYIIAPSSAGLIELVDVTTGETIPLTFSRGLDLPVWKP